MDLGKNIENEINFNELTTDSQETNNCDYSTSVENAFDKMKIIQKNITIKKIADMDEELSKLEKELNEIIDSHSKSELNSK